MVRGKPPLQWQKPLQYCKVISLQLIKINEKNAKKQNKTKDKLDLLLALKYSHDFLLLTIQDLNVLLTLKS